MVTVNLFEPDPKSQAAASGEQEGPASLFAEEGQAETGLKRGSAGDNEGVGGAVEGLEFSTEETGEEGAEVEGAEVAGHELALSALRSPQPDGPPMGEEGAEVGAEEGLDAEGNAKGQGVDGEDAGEMQVGELQAEGRRRGGAGPGAAEGEVAPPADREAEELEADKPQAATITPAAAPVTDQALNEATALAAMSGDPNADKVFHESKGQIASALSQDAAQTGLTVDVKDVVKTTETAVQDQTPAPDAPAAAAPEPEAPARTEPAAAKAAGVAVRFAEMEPWVKELSQKFQGMVDPAQFVNLAAANISPTGKVPQEHGAGMAYNPSLPNLGGGPQLAV